MNDLAPIAASLSSTRRRCLSCIAKASQSSEERAAFLIVRLAAAVMIAETEGVCDSCEGHTAVFRLL